MAQVNVEDDWTSLDDLVALHTAEDAAELRRRLLCFGYGGGNKADAFEPGACSGRSTPTNPRAPWSPLCSCLRSMSSSV